ncbi:proto-oncogene Mas-like [Pogona vitticeps]
MVSIYFSALFVIGIDSLWCLSSNRLLTTARVLFPANEYNDSGDAEFYILTYQLDNLMENIINGFILLISLLGLVGNGVVIWLLGFRIKRNPYATYILNLSVADFGVLICLIFIAISNSVDTQNGINPPVYLYFYIIFELFFFAYSTSQFLLAAISIERCVAVIFPLWHQCHRPPHLSAIACALIWILSFLLPAVSFTLLSTGILFTQHLLFQLIVNVFLCAPLMLISTLILFIKVYNKANQRHKQGKLVTAILLALLFFLIFALPLNVFYITLYFCFRCFSSYTSFYSLLPIGLLCASLNSSINPLIYFLVGQRQRHSQVRVSMKVALKKVFEDEQDCKREQNTQSETLE